MMAIVQPIGISAIDHIEGHSVTFIVIGMVILFGAVLWLMVKVPEKYLWLVNIMLLAATATSCWFMFMFMLNTIGYQASEILKIFVIGLLIWTALFHIAAFYFAHNLVHSISNLFGKDPLPWVKLLGTNWVKAIDYIYLLLSSISILRIVVSTITTDEGSRYLNTFATVLLGFAVALRITRTSIEIFEWDKQPPGLTHTTSAHSAAPALLFFVVMTGFILTLLLR